MATTNHASHSPASRRRSPESPDDIPDLAGKTAIVTGGNRGLGFQVALELAKRGADVTLGCRDEDLGDIARRRILEQAPHADVEALPLDLADLDKVRAFTDKVRGNHPAVDLLVNCGGVMSPPHGVTADGYELQFGTNHLGHFALTGRLLPLLMARPAGRIVTVTSNAHTQAFKRGRSLLPDVTGRRYRPAESPLWLYARSKGCNAMFAVHLQRLIDEASTDTRPATPGGLPYRQPEPLRSVAAHPGFAATDLPLTGPWQHQARTHGVGRVGHRAMEWGYRGLRATLAQSVEAGAASLVYAAVDPEVPGAALVGPRGFAQLRGEPGLLDFHPGVHDVEVGQRLWDLSEQLTGVNYRFNAYASAS